MAEIAVAPFAGAWIETRSEDNCYPLTESLPSRERGLKLTQLPLLGRVAKSLPSRERGLKPNTPSASAAVKEVAPFAGAWIETALLS